MANIRLFVDHALAAGQLIPLTREQAHYLFSVMRLGVGDTVTVFNGSDGAWSCAVVEAGKKGGSLVAEAQSAPQVTPPDVALYFAPIKKARTDFIVEKAAELGVRQICPMQTDFTNSERLRQDRLQAHAGEAAEQCGGTYVPEVMALQKMSTLLNGWDAARQILFCDETLVDAQKAFPTATQGQPWAIFIGPEGGFSEAERDRLRALPQAHPVSLGPRVLRADTAAVAALTLWQHHLGDWQ